MNKRLIYSVIYTTLGVLHFLQEPSFTKIMPPFILYKKELVYITGIMELFFGIFMLLKKPGRLFKVIIKLFLIAVFPANVYMAVKKVDLDGRQLPPAVLWGRLPMQWLIIKEMDKL